MKLRWDMYNWLVAESELRVMMHGAKKYGDEKNYLKVDHARRRYYAAAQRHLLAWWVGEEKDPETGESHLSHLRCCARILLELEAMEKAK